MKKKALLSSILTIALCMSLIAGSTYALFTSSAKVNVSATAGTVEIYATIDESSISSGSTLGDNKNLPETSFTFDTDSNTIVLDKIVPGDYVDFNILINNTGSNVSIKYRTVIKVAEDNGLWSGLAATIDGETYTGEYKSSEWEVLAPNAGEITVPVRLELPAAAGNKYQGKTCTVAYLVEAVQMNGTIEETGVNDLANAIANAAPGATINLAAEDFGTYELDGEISDLTIIADPDTSVVFHVPATATLDNVTFQGLSLENLDGYNAGNLNGLVQIEAGAKVDITFDGCHFDTLKKSEGAAYDYAAVRCQEASAKIAFVNCTFNDCKYSFYSSNAPIAELTYENCHFYNMGSWAIQTQSVKNDPVVLSVVGCYFENCLEGILKVGGTFLAGSEITFSDNTVVDCAGHDGMDTKWFGLNATEADVVIENNVRSTTKANGDLFTEEWTPSANEGFNYTVNP